MVIKRILLSCRSIGGPEGGVSSSSGISIFSVSTGVSFSSLSCFSVVFLSAFSLSMESFSRLFSFLSSFVFVFFSLSFSSVRSSMSSCLAYAVLDYP